MIPKVVNRNGRVMFGPVNDPKAVEAFRRFNAPMRPSQSMTEQEMRRRIGNRAVVAYHHYETEAAKAGKSLDPTIIRQLEKMVEKNEF